MQKSQTEGQKMRAEYYRKWRAEHPGKQTEYTRRYWERKAQQNQNNKNGSQSGEEV